MSKDLSCHCDNKKSNILACDGSVGIFSLQHNAILTDAALPFRWKKLLEPIALMTNIHQAAHSKPEHVPISFGFLYYRYSRIGDESDLVARNAVLESAEHCWAQVDQEVFIAAVIIDPLYKDKPFSNIPLTTRAGLMSLFSRLWTRFYGGTPPLKLFTDLDNYLKSSPKFQPLNIYTQILVSHANDQVICLLELYSSISNLFLPTGHTSRSS